MVAIRIRLSQGVCVYIALIISMPSPMEALSLRHRRPASWPESGSNDLSLQRRGQIMNDLLVEMAQDESEDYGTGPWNMSRIFADEPKGAYLNLVKPVLYVNYLTYPETAPERFDSSGKWKGTVIHDKWKANATTLGKLNGQGGWERLWWEDEDHHQGGTHMNAIINAATKRAIIAFRGACLDSDHEQCLTDLCMVSASRTDQGPNVAGIFHSDAMCKVGITKYMEEAIRGIERVRQSVGHDYAMIVTGHSFGGELAQLLDAHPKAASLDFTSLTLEPTPWGNMLRNVLGWTPAMLNTLNRSRRWAIYDRWDLLSVKGDMVQLRPATNLCIYDSELPKACSDCVTDVRFKNPDWSAGRALDECFLYPTNPKLHYSLCKDAVHFLDNYASRLLLLRDAAGDTVLPKCITMGV